MRHSPIIKYCKGTILYGPLKDTSCTYATNYKSIYCKRRINCRPQLKVPGGYVLCGNNCLILTSTRDVDINNTNNHDGSYMKDKKK